VVLPDGHVRWINVTARSRASAPNRARNRLTGVSIDVTERRLAAAAHQVNEARMATAIDVAKLGFYEYQTDGSTTRVFIDDHLRAILGVPADEEQRLDQYWRSQTHPDDRDRVTAASRQVLEGARDAAHVEYRYRNPQRGTIWLGHASRVLARLPNGRAARTVGVLLDITTRKEREGKLRDALDEVERLRDRLQAENASLREEVVELQGDDRIIGRSPAILRAFNEARQVAATSSTVLLLGETGTGKERFANAIHRMSARRDRVMVRVSCAAIPASLIESELFGRERGAYTGALARQIGRFERANGSTIFLDEIGDLPPEVQVKLLRVLQEREVERLGGSRPIPVDVRVIAATNRDLGREIRKGRFREDLFSRLNVFPITIPPLRERPEDIALLVRRPCRNWLAWSAGASIRSIRPASMRWSPTPGPATCANCGTSSSARS
jgi:transcriptional regulator with GAF, ATPase, and Fis domain